MHFRYVTSPSPCSILRMPNILLMPIVHLIAILTITAVVAALQTDTDAVGIACCNRLLPLRKLTKQRATRRDFGTCQRLQKSCRHYLLW